MEARALFAEGRLAFGEGRFEDAAEAFARAHELSPRPELLYNLAFSLDRLRRDHEALETYRAYLDADPNTTNRSSVNARIAAIEEAIEERRAEEAEAAERARSEARDEGGTPWWLWAGIGAVVVAAVLVVVIVAASGEDLQRSPPVAGDDGMIIEALRFP
jgi:tetratricopeptide (TPR) repeat protein